MRRLNFFILMLAILVGGAAMAAENGTLKIKRADGKTVALTVEIVRSEADKEQGLMNRTALADGHGMLFVESKPAPVYMWMKNTLVPLDMLFFDVDGRIIHIEQNAQPGDLHPRGTAQPVCLSLEIKGGQAAALGLAVGDKIFAIGKGFDCLRSAHG